MHQQDRCFRLLGHRTGGENGLPAVRIGFSAAIGLGRVRECSFGLGVVNMRKLLIMKVAASLGLEPRQTDPESVVLPLHYEAVEWTGKE